MDVYRCWSWIFEYPVCEREISCFKDGSDCSHCWDLNPVPLAYEETLWIVKFTLFRRYVPPDGEQIYLNYVNHSVSFRETVDSGIQLGNVR